jgi:hypothetical protein
MNANIGAGLTYQWIRNGVPISNATNDSYTTPANQSGRYKVEVTNSFGCTTTSNVDTLVRLHTPAAHIIIVNPSGNPDLCINDKVKLRGNGSSAYTLAYEWYRNNILVGTDRDYIATLAGSYKVKVTDTNTGCSRISTPVSVFSSCKEMSCTGNVKASMSTYPNPTDGHFVIDLQLNEAKDADATIMIFNAIGQMVYGVVLPVLGGSLNKEIMLDSNYASGIYFIKVNVNNQALSGLLLYQK